MDKNIYDLLNEVETDFTEYSEDRLSDIENKINSKKLLNKIKDNRPNQKISFWSRHKVLRIVSTVAAAFAVIISIGSIANPAFAREQFSKVVGLLIQSTEGDKYEEDKTLYNQVGENATVVDEAALPAEYTTTATSQDTTISISDIYCDGYYIYYTMHLTSTNENLNLADWIREGNGSAVHMILNDYDSEEGYIRFAKGEDGSYVGIGSIDLLYYELFEDLTFNEEEGILIDYSLTELVGSKNEWDSNGEYVETARIMGEWHFNFPVDIDSSNNQTWELELQENGICLNNITKTSANLIIEINLPDMTKDPYNDPYNDPAMTLYDSNYNMIPWSSVIVVPNDDGSSTCYMTCTYSAETDFILQVVNKNVDNSVLADIDITLN